MSESNLWDRVRNNVKHYGIFTRIECPLIAGIADVNYLLPRGCEGWMELKHATLPARPSTMVFNRYGLSDEQIAWLEARSRIDGKVWICAGVDSNIFLVRGRLAGSFNQLTYKQITTVATWKGGPRLEDKDWYSFVQTLRS